MVFLVASGLFYQAVKSTDPADALIRCAGAETAFSGSICLPSVKIEREMDLFLAVTPRVRIGLSDLPEQVQQNIFGDFSIKGRISQRNRLTVDKIRRKGSRTVKLACSAVTALIGISMFFFFFDPKPGGFAPREVY